MDLKLVILVRDPRSIYHSRKKMAMYNQKKNANDVDMSHYQTRLAAECSKTAANYDFYQNSTASIKSKIRTIRYEDLALNFPMHAKEYFLNIPSKLF